MELKMSPSEIERVLSHYASSTSNVQSYNTMTMLPDGSAMLSFDPMKEPPAPEPAPAPRHVTTLWRAITFQFPEGGYRRAEKPSRTATIEPATPWAREVAQ